MPRCPSGSTCTPFESSFAIVAIKSFTDSSHALSIESLNSFEFYGIKGSSFLKIEVVNLIRLDLTSFVLGLGVFGLVDVTVDGMGGVVWHCDAGCFSAFCGFNDILKEFSFKGPFLQNCIDRGFWLG